MELDGVLDELIDVFADKLAARMNEKKNGPVVEPKLLTIKQAAPYLARTEPALRAMIANGEIPQALIKRVGGRVFLVKRDLDSWIHAQ